MVTNKLENIEAILLIAILSLNGIILSTGQYIVSMCSSSSLLNAIMISIIAIIITVLFCILTKKLKGKDLLEVSQYIGGSPLKFIIGIIFISYFTFRCIIFLKKITNCLQIVYFPMTNLVFIISLFCIGIGFIVLLKNNAIFKSSVLFFGLSSLSIILIFLGNIKNFNFENIFPLLGNGINSTFFSGISNIFAFSGLAYILFLPSKLKKPEKHFQISLIGIILSAIFLILSIANILLLFSDTLNNSELFPLYNFVRYIEFGIFFQRLDSTFLFICVLSSICSLSLNTYIVIDIFKNILKLSDRKPIIYPYILILLSLCLIITKDSTLEFLENTVYRIYFGTVTILLPLILLIIGIIKQKINKEN